ncbi:MAG: nitronate monooxygenase [Rhizobiales bacterium PAR1]|nr:MAG: nitronate monooxygenase [Rhizobiales bacterium PAR1]
MTLAAVRARTDAFCRQTGLSIPIALAPMAGACPVELSIAVANAGAMGALGALMLTPEAIAKWMADFRAASKGPVQINLWVPDAPPRRDAMHEGAVRRHLEQWGPPVFPGDADTPLQDYEAQFQALLDSKPDAAASVMGLFEPDKVRELKARGIPWVAAVTTVRDALAAEKAGADIIAVQGFEAGGHRGAFTSEPAEAEAVGLLSLIPAVADAVSRPIIATGGIADGRTILASLVLGASAVQIGTAFLRAPEAKIAPAWADALGATKPEETTLTRAFSGRAGRGIATDYVRASAAPEVPRPAPYPIQRGMTRALREQGIKSNDLQRMQAWAGQSAKMARVEPAAEIVARLWRETEALLG